MTLRWLLAALHLIALGLGLGAVWVRGSALRAVARRSTTNLTRVFAADSAWGIAALLWISTGLVRAFGGVEKGTTYYLTNHFFLAKMGLFVLVFALEIWPMITLIRWRIRTRRGTTVNTGPALAFARISVVQAVLIVCMVFAAAAMARGMGTIR